MAYTPINWDEVTPITPTNLNKMDNQIDTNEQRLTDIDNKATGTVTNDLQGQIDTNDNRISSNDNDISNLFSLKNIKTSTGSFSGKSHQQDSININNAYILQIKVSLSLNIKNRGSVNISITNTPLISGGEETKQFNLDLTRGSSDNQNFYYNDTYFTSGNLSIDYSPGGDIFSVSGSYEIKYIEL